MTKLSKKQVLHVAHLASLKLKASEVKKVKAELSEVVSFVDQLKKVNTKGIVATHQTTGLSSVTREDEVVVDDCLNNNEALSATENTHNGYFVVSAVLEKEKHDK